MQSGCQFNFIYSQSHWMGRPQRYRMGKTFGRGTRAILQRNWSKAEAVTYLSRFRHYCAPWQCSTVYRWAGRHVWYQRDRENLWSWLLTRKKSDSSQDLYQKRFVCPIQMQVFLDEDGIWYWTSPVIQMADGGQSGRSFYTGQVLRSASRWDCGAVQPSSDAV